MEQKRPLVWLSADSGENTVPSSLTSQWAIVPVDINTQSLAILPHWRGLAVGVCVVADLELAGLPLFAPWLEALPVSSWLALVRREQLQHPAVRHLIREFCQDYHTLPIAPYRLSDSLGHMWGMSKLTEALASSDHASDYQQYALEGPSSAIRMARSLVRKFSITNEPLLIYGASGTGKEAAARFAHEHSDRRTQVLVNVNCAALPASLTQSELFGHERGAFTHALNKRMGRIAAADGGTLVLTGADELSLEQQSAILRFLQDGIIEPVGASRPIKVNVRIIATCSVPLEKRVEQGLFRSDVFYRLGNLSVTLPTLKERLEDIPFLARRALDACDGSQYQIGSDTLVTLARHSWPGNLRELQNRIRQAVLMTKSLHITPEDLGLEPTGAPAQPDRFTLEAFRARAEEQAISTSLSLTHQNVSAAARLLKISRVSFYRLLEKHNLQLPSSINLNPGRGQGDRT